MVKRILVPLDGSNQSLKALPMACIMTRLNAAELVFLTVTYFDESTDDGLELGGLWLESPLVGSVKGYTEKVFAEAKQQIDKDIKIVTYHLQGRPEEEIPKFINNNQVDMVVIGCKNLSFVDHILKGSVSRQIIEKSKCPVIIVK